MTSALPSFGAGAMAAAGPWLAPPLPPAGSDAPAPAAALWLPCGLGGLPLPSLLLLLLLPVMELAPVGCGRPVGCRRAEGRLLLLSKLLALLRWLPLLPPGTGGC